MRIGEIYDYRNARSVLESVDRSNIEELMSVLDDQTIKLRLGAQPGKSQNISRQLQDILARKGWKTEKPLYTLPDLRYDLVKGEVPVEIEIGHERLVYAVFFKFLADYSARKIPAGVIVVTANPKAFGHTWPNSVTSTRRKIEAIQSYFLVPIFTIGILP